MCAPHKASFHQVLVNSISSSANMASTDSNKIDIDPRESLPSCKKYNTSDTEHWKGTIFFGFHQYSYKPHFRSCPGPVGATPSWASNQHHLSWTFFTSKTQRAMHSWWRGSLCLPGTADPHIMKVVRAILQAAGLSLWASAYPVIKGLLKGCVNALHSLECHKPLHLLWFHRLIQLSIISIAMPFYPISLNNTSKGKHIQSENNFSK